MNLQSGTTDILWYQVVQGIGFIFAFVPMTTMTMGPIPKSDMGYATSLNSMMRNIGQSFGISFVTTFLARRTQFHRSILVSHITVSNPNFLQYLHSLTGYFTARSGDIVRARLQAMTVLDRMIERQALTISFIDCFWLMGIMFSSVVPLILFMRKRNSPAATSLSAH